MRRGVTHLAQAPVERGGWYEGRWLTKAEAAAAQHRWADRSFKTLPDGTFQCGGCKFFAALGGDYGLCWNSKSEHDGRVTFEHGGCSEHSRLASVEAPR